MTEMRDIPGYEGVYAVTRDGRVWAYPRTWITGRYALARNHQGKWLHLFKAPNGYMMVGLSRNGQKKHHGVHRLVAITWIPNPVGLPQINHINAVKDDNRDTNLEWCTASHNKRHAHSMGCCPVTPAFLSSVRRNVLKAHEATRGKPRRKAA